MGIHQQANLQQEEEDAIDLNALYHMLRRGKHVILIVAAGTLLIATAIAFLLPEKYTSSTSFIPPTQGGGNSIANAVAGQLSALGAGGVGEALGGIKNSGDMYAGILKSRSILSE